MFKRINLTSIKYILNLVALSFGISFFTFNQVYSVTQPNADSDKIIVLLLSGKNNHNWEATTPVIQKILEENGKFTVTIINSPEKLSPNELEKFDVILSNWSDFPNISGNRWSKYLEEAFLNFVSKGNGFVAIHAASATLQDWPEFQQIVGGTWELGVTGHGPIHVFEVNTSEINHPITNGLDSFFIRDELWHKTKFQPEIKILLEAFSDKEKGGTGANEPVGITSQYGQGRCFYNLLGHDEKSMQNNAWKTILLRSVEWAATGNVTFDPIKPWPYSKETATKQSN